VVQITIFTHEENLEATARLDGTSR